VHERSWLSIPRRALTHEEQGWIKDILSASKEWADVCLDELYVVGKCACGCRTVLLEPPQRVQNPRLTGQKGLVGEIDLTVRIGDKEDVVSVFLHHVAGNLRELEVVWYNFPDPVPSSWIEVHRTVTAAA
jgi:hypothetical protein